MLIFLVLIMLSLIITFLLGRDDLNDEIHDTKKNEEKRDGADKDYTELPSWQTIDPQDLDYVVDPYQTYTYDQMEQDLDQLKENYGDLLEVRTIGKSVLGKDLYAVRIGNEDNTILVEASHHAREWISTNLTMKKLDRYAYKYVQNEKIGEFNIREILDDVGIWFVPMVNPDGVTLHQKGLDGIPEEYHDEFVDYNVDWAGEDFYLWKANINGVDLNRQYPADWEDSDCTGVRFAMNYKGEEPLSEPESQALYEFTKETKPLSAISYHTRGQVIFWYYHNKHLERDQEIGDQLSELTGYTLYPPRPDYRGANFNDWFIQKFDRPAYILELVPFTGDEEDRDLDYLKTEWKNNREVAVFLAKVANKKLK